MNQLPNEILEVIFGYIPYGIEPLFFTCKLWNSIITKMQLKSGPSKDLLLKGESNFKFVLSLTLNTHELKNNMLFPNLKTIVVLYHKPEDNDKLINFLSNHLSLESLDIREARGDFTLEDDKFIQELSKILQNLKRLIKFSYDGFIENNAEIFFSSFIKLSIKYLNLKVRLKSIDIMKLISTHLKLIEVLKIQFWFDAPFDIPDNLLKFNYPFPHLKSLYVDVIEFRYITTPLELLPKYLPVLTEFTTNNGNALFKWLDTNCLHQFLNLTLKIKVDGDEVLDRYRGLANYEGLDVKELDHRIYNEDEFSPLCDSLQHFRNITKLLIYFGNELYDGVYLGSFYDSNLLKPAFKQLNQLKDLTIDNLSNDDIFSEQFDFSLKSLSLTFKDSALINNINNFIFFYCPDLESLRFGGAFIDFTTIDLTKVKLKKLKEMYLTEPAYTYKNLFEFISQLPNIRTAELYPIDFKLYPMEIIQMLRSKFPYLYIKHF